MLMMVARLWQRFCLFWRVPELTKLYQVYLSQGGQAPCGNGSCFPSRDSLERLSALPTPSGADLQGTSTPLGSYEQLRNIAADNTMMTLSPPFTPTSGASPITLPPSSEPQTEPSSSFGLSPELENLLGLGGDRRS